MHTQAHACPNLLQNSVLIDSLNQNTQSPEHMLGNYVSAQLEIS